MMARIFVLTVVIWGVLANSVYAEEINLAPAKLGALFLPVAYLEQSIGIQLAEVQKQLGDAPISTDSATSTSLSEVAYSSSNCNEVLVAAYDTGGCHIRLVEPAICEAIDLSNGKMYAFGWTTDGSYCETPYRLYLAGNPADLNTGQNIHWWDLSENVEQGITHYGGIINVSAATLTNAGLTSADGIYHWVIVGWYGSHPASQTFQVITGSTYQITTSASPGVGGTVSCEPNPVNSNSNSVCMVTPATGYHVDTVTVDGNPATVTGGTTYTFSNVTTAHSISVTFAATVISDTVAPVISEFSIPVTSNSLTVSISTFKATDNMGVTGYLITETATKPSATLNGWSTTVPSTYSASNTGSKTLYAWAKDAAGNVSASLSASVVIDIPSIGSMSGRVAIDMAGYSDLGVRNAAVSLQGTSYSVTTDNDGNFTLANIPYGGYNLIITAPKLNSLTQYVSLSQPSLQVNVPQMTVSQGQSLQGDANSDGRLGLDDAIYILQVLSRVR